MLQSERAVDLWKMLTVPCCKIPIDISARIRREGERQLSRVSNGIFRWQPGHKPRLYLTPVPISLTKELTGHPGRLILPFSNGGLWLYSTFYNISTQIMIASIYFSQALNNKIGHFSEQTAQDTLVEGSILDDDQVSTWFILLLV